MRRERPDVAFEVAEDIPGGRGAKRFTFFASVEEFFKSTAHLHQRCFYEILAETQHVVLYFDVEHYTEGSTFVFRLKHIHVCSLVVQLSQEAPLDFLQGHYKLIQLLDALCLRLEQ
jgi:hypothetical protein